MTQPGRACTRVLVLLGLDLVETRECHPQPGRACTRVLVLLGLDLVETRECHLHHAWRDVHHRAPPRSAAGPESTVSGCG